MADFHINIFHSEADDYYAADIPDLRFCSALAETPEGALQEVLKAKEAWIAAARERGEEPPPPEYEPSAADG